MDLLILVGVFLILIGIFAQLTLLVYVQLKALGFAVSPPLFPTPQITREDPKAKAEPKEVALENFTPDPKKPLKLIFEEDPSGTHGVSEGEE
jgi:hypothetical protein